MMIRSLCMMIFAMALATPLIGVAEEATPTPTATPMGPLQFPADRSLGLLKTYDRAASKWKELGEAKGEVTPPAGAALTLVVSKEGVTDLSAIAKLPAEALSAVTLDALEVTDAQIVHLAGQKKLKKLTLRGATITPAVLEKISGIKSIEELDLNLTSANDESIKPLKDLPNLAVLDISYTQVSDAAIETLAGFAGLQYIDPQRSKITPKGEDELREAIPGCTVVTR